MLIVADQSVPVTVVDGQLAFREAAIAPIVATGYTHKEQLDAEVLRKAWRDYQPGGR